MKNLWKLIIVVLLAVAVIAVVVLRHRQIPPQTAIVSSQPVQPAAEPRQSAAETNIPAVAAKLPKFIELGADKCIPCKMMKPILDELTVEYKGKLDVIFYDVWKNPAYGEKYRIDIIPTQIFLDPNDKELFRHQGFFPKADILAKWKELGFDFSSSSQAVQ